MAISIITGGTQSNGAANGADVTLTFPTLAQGDVVYVCAGRANGGPTISSSGWGSPVQTATNGTHVVNVWRKTMGATPDTTVVVVGGGAAATATTAVSLCLRGVDNTAPEGNTQTANGSSTNPDAGQVTTSRNNSWVCVFASSRVSDASVTIPSGYSNGLSTNQNDTDASTISRATKLVATSGTAENPASWTGWSTGTWGALTVEVKEAPVTGSLAATESGADTASFSGQVIVQGALSVTETGSDTFAADGTVGAAGVTGDLAATEVGADTFAGGGTVLVEGALAATESGADVFAGTGDVIVAGALAATESGADVFASTGTVLVSGLLAAIESGADAFAGVGAVLVSGALDATETGEDTFYATSVSEAAGELAASEIGADAFVATGAVETRVGGGGIYNGPEVYRKPTRDELVRLKRLMGLESVQQVKALFKAKPAVMEAALQAFRYSGDAEALLAQIQGEESYQARLAEMRQAVDREALNARRAMLEDEALTLLLILAAIE